MAQNLKRKRDTQDRPRKARKLSDDEDEDGGEDNISAHSQRESEGSSDGEGDEWSGINPGEQDKPQQLSDTKPFKPPTGVELRTIRDASDLFKSNSFKLQIDALLPNIRPKEKRLPLLESFLLSLHTLIMNLPSVSPQHPLEASRRLIKKGIAIPYSQPLPSEDTNWKVAFQPPSAITLVGSWANKVSVRSKDDIRFGVDLALEMPAELFQEKDYLNGRFFQKRAFYLATLAAALTDAKAGLNLQATYRSVSDNPRLTNLILVEEDGETKSGLKRLHCEICIIPVLPTESPIPIHRLSPLQANIRLHPKTSPSEVESYAATPLYNSSLLLAVSTKSRLLSVHAMKQGVASFHDALALLRVWANQRGFSEGSRLCVHGFERKGPFWSALLELLIHGEEVMDPKRKLKRKPVGKGLSSYQLFRAALDFLSKHDFEKDAVFLKTSEKKYSLDQFAGYPDPIFVDSSSVNLLADVPLGSLRLLGHDAQRTLSVLDASQGDPFSEVFLKDCRDLPTRFDLVLYVDLSTSKPRNLSPHSVLDFGSTTNALMSSLSSILTEGLGDRIKAVVLLHPSSTSRPLSQAHPSTPHIVHIGLLYNPHNAFRQVDHGPSATDAENPSSLRFRELWGAKAELRRFKDGSITESVVWEVKTADEKAHIPTMIVRHLLRTHFVIEDQAIQAWQEPFDALVKLPESMSRMYMESGLSIGFKGAINAFDALVKQLKALPDDQLPLALVTVSAVSECLRYTSTFAPVPLPPSFAAVLPPSARYLHPIDFVLEFEKSSKWPDDLRAIQKTKLAFLERFSSLLMASVDGLKASVVTGDGPNTSEICDQASLEIITADGWAFSGRIHTEREAVLLDRIIENKANRLPHVAPGLQDAKRDKEYYAAVQAKELYLRRFIHAPLHHRAIAKLSHHFGAYPGTVRLVKRWLACHCLLHSHISEEVVELICARFFVTDGWEQKIESGQGIAHLGVPASKEHGFGLVIEFLKDWKWEEGLYIHLYGTDPINTSERSTKPTPQTTPPSAWALSTLVDTDGHVWTRHSPDAVVARRITAIAHGTWQYLRLMEEGRLLVPPIFTHPTNDYDFIVHLDPGVLPRYFQNIATDGEKLGKQGKYSNLIPTECTTSVRPGFDPARSLFLDIQRVYFDSFKLFYDPFGGDYYAGVWDPSLNDRKAFKVLAGYSSIPCQKDGQKEKSRDLVQLNRTSVLSEIERMGRILVKGITVRSET